MNMIPLFNSDSLSAQRIVLFSVSRIPSSATIKQIKEFDSLYNEFVNLGINDIYCLTLNEELLYNMLLPKLSNKIKFVSGIEQVIDLFNKRGNIEFLKQYWHFVSILDNFRIEQYNEQPFKEKLGTDTNVSFYSEISPRKLLTQLTQN